MLQKITSAILFLLAAYWAYELDAHNAKHILTGAAILVPSFLSGFYLGQSK